jgi:nitrogen fixation/metabolism regulation signal transduction histidine kinase
LFKTAKYRFALFLALLVVSVGVGVWFIAGGSIFYGLLALCVAVVAIGGVVRSYERRNRNFVFLLNAIENGDYSFNFSSDSRTLSRREQELSLVLNAIKDILIRARDEEIENEKFLSLIVAAIPVGIVIIDERDFVKAANDAALKLLGLSVFTHIRQLGMVDERVMEAFGSVTPRRGTTLHIADEREERLISLGVSTIRIKKGALKVFTMHNIAGELEEREMESWIKLIRVMTHEIMNSIAPINSLSETMGYAWAHSADNPDEAGRLQRNTMEAFATITSTARGLLSFVESYRRFTGIPKPQLHPLQLGQLAEKVVNLEKNFMDNRNIRILMRPNDSDVTVSADEGQISQVLVNLLKNAAEAIDAGRGDGRVEVHVWRDGESAVHIDVTNNGTPIPEDVLPHIFVPFFTTKDSGTGIGLSVSRYIMRLHGGNLKHHAEGDLTTFSMVFP